MHGRYIILTFFLLIISILASQAQDCDVDFPGTSTLLYSVDCSGDPTPSNLNFGLVTAIGDNDTFTFDSPATITASGNFIINAEGSGKIIIPAGVTLNITGFMQLNQSGGCSSGSPCTFEIVVNGTLNVSGNFQNNLTTLIWSGSGTVDVDGQRHELVRQLRRRP